MSPGSREKSITGVTELYLHYHFRLSAGFWGHVSNTNKLGPFVCITTSGAQIFLNAHGTDNNTLYPRVVLQGCVPSLGGNDASGSGSYGGTSVSLTRDTTYSWEVYIKLNTYNVADGILQSWVNGVRHLNKTNAALIGSGTSPVTAAGSKLTFLRVDFHNGLRGNMYLRELTFGTTVASMAVATWHGRPASPASSTSSASPAGPTRTPSCRW